VVLAMIEDEQTALSQAGVAVLNSWHSRTGCNFGEGQALPRFPVLQTYPNGPCKVPRNLLIIKADRVLAMHRSGVCISLASGARFFSLLLGSDTMAATQPAGWGAFDHFPAGKL
jgi:hypothetical protein